MVNPAKSPYAVNPTPRENFLGPRFPTTLHDFPRLGTTFHEFRRLCTTFYEFPRLCMTFHEGLFVVFPSLHADCGICQVPKSVVFQRVVLADVPRERKRERGYIRMFPRNANLLTGTRVRSLDPPERKPERGHVRQNHPFTKPPFCLLSSCVIRWGWLNFRERPPVLIQLVLTIQAFNLLLFSPVIEGGSRSTICNPPPPRGKVSFCTPPPVASHALWN